MATTLLNKPKGLATYAKVAAPTVQPAGSTVVKPIAPPTPVGTPAISGVPVTAAKTAVAPVKAPAAPVAPKPGVGLATIGTPGISGVPVSPGRGINETPSYTDTRPPSERTPAPVTPKTGPGISDVPETPGKVWRNGEFVDTRVPGEGTGTGAWKNGEFVDTRVPGENGGGGAWKNGEFVDTRVPGEGGGGGVKTPTPGGFVEQKLINTLQPGYDPKTGLITPIKTGGGISDVPEVPGRGGISDIPERPGDKINPLPNTTLPSGLSNPTMAPRTNAAAPVKQAIPTGVNLPSGNSNPTMTTRVDPTAPVSTAKSYDDWAAKAAAEVDDSTANRLREMLSQDSPLMQQARTDGLKVANSRGLLNSSMAAGASQDSMIRAATPIAQQDASQAFQKNLQGRDYTYGLASQFAGQEFAGDQAALDRNLEVSLQNASLNAADAQQIRDIASNEGIAAANRALTELTQDKDIAFQGNENALNRDLETRMQNASLDAADMQQIRDIQSQEGVAAAERALAQMQQERDIQFQSGENQLNRTLEERMQNTAITAADRQQIRDIESREGTAAAERALQEKLQGRDIEFQSGEREKDREIQKWIAESNLDASDRNAASQFITNMETMYQTSYQSIMANTALSAAQRTEQLTAAARMRDQQLDFVRQMYDIELTWGQAPGSNNGPNPSNVPETPGNPATAPRAPTTTPANPVVPPRTPVTTGPGGGRNS